MSVELPELAFEEFSQRLGEAVSQRPEDTVVERLFTHYRELARWNRRLSLIGPGTVQELIERHYAESLAGLELLHDQDRVVVDLGSGAGFPGWVIAAARPDLDVTLVEARQRKWSFLSQVSQKAALPCHCLNARVSAALPGGFPSQVDLVLMRAVRLGGNELSTVASRLSPTGRFLLWSGENRPVSVEGWEIGQTRSLAGSRSRCIVEWVRGQRRETG